jgi:type II restriction enzyme
MQMKLSAANIVKAIMGLPKGRWFEYIEKKTKSQIRVVSNDGPEGPIQVERRTPSKDGGAPSITPLSLSRQMIWRIANASAPNVPINFDRVLAGSYNSRSLLEALLVHAPEFYWCKPGRIEFISDSPKIKTGHKHMVWMPDTPHKNGILTESKVSSGLAVSEILTQSAIYDSLAITKASVPADMDINIKRRHLQIQIALIEIGNHLGFNTWIAHNDKGFKYGDKTVGELDGVVANLADEQVLAAYNEAQKAAHLIDCIWFKDGKRMPAVMEVEQSTGVTSGLIRMKNFQDSGPGLADIRWVIVAADEDREKVIRKANVEQFSTLDTRYFSYSAVEELYDLCKRRKLSKMAVNEAFLDCFLEPCLPRS